MITMLYDKVLLQKKSIDLFRKRSSLVVTAPAEGGVAAAQSAPPLPASLV